MERKPITVVIADDHPVFRKGLRDIIGEDKECMVVGETGDGAYVLELIHAAKPDVLLLDLNMPGTGGLDIAMSIQKDQVPVNVVILTMHKERSMFNKAMDLGVRGYVLKESAVNDILDSIKMVADDGYYISPTISQYLVDRQAQADSLLQTHPGLNDLSPAEHRVLKLISENRTSREIADMLFVSLRTIENHRMNICNKLNLHGGNALLKFAIENKHCL